MWVIQFIHREGGTATLSDADPVALRQRAARACERFSGAWVAASMPFENAPGEHLPAWWRGDGGEDLTRLTEGEGS